MDHILFGHHDFASVFGDIEEKWEFGGLLDDVFLPWSLNKFGNLRSTGKMMLSLSGYVVEFPFVRLLIGISIYRELVTSWGW